MTNLKKKILYLSEAYHGSCHDFKVLREEFDPTKAKWFSGKQIWVDLGFQGIQKYYRAEVKMPIKKTRKSVLTKLGKEYNQAISKIRVKVEHAIGGIKRYKILSHRLRMKNMAKYNQVAGICAALWNFILIV